VRTLVAAALLLVPPLALRAQEDKDKAKALAEEAAKNPLDFDRSIGGLFRTHCYRCHNDEKRKGDVNLARDENPRMIARNRKLWLTVQEVLEQEQMPPKKEKQPTPEQRKNLIEFLKKTLTLDCDRVRDPGKPSTRRLNRTEYNNSILELTGLALHLADDFSPDATGYGFDNIGEVLAVSPVLIEQYHQAAQRLLSELIDQKGAHPEAHRRVFFVQPSKELAEREAARRIVERFALKAFRRPADPALIDKLLGLYDRARTAGGGHEASVRPMLTAILISPRFFMRIESARPAVEGPYPVDDYDLAARLSYFLWSGPPDDELLGLAGRGALGSAEALEAQARRLLADPRSQALVENFFGQWLQLRGLATHKPDAKRFPGFTESLRAAMQQELSLFLGEVIRRDRPLTELVDADYTYVNEELARHYGMEGVRGGEMRRVALKDRRRGGLLTSAAVLMIQSDPERTNVPRRGNYIAGSILGSPPPPPPPDVPSLDASRAEGKVQTLREVLEAHRSRPECAGCHSKIDPLGFGLENFDAIGRWRDLEAGAPVDASGVLPGGRSFRGPLELKAILVERRDEFVRTMAANLLIFALGRGLQLEDECVLRDVQKAAAADEYRFSSVVLAITRSFPFRNRRNPDF
jgi:mono/diheme cytochrome c family protein